MILAAGLLVLLGLGLFIGGVVSGATALYWGCVAACVVAAVLLAVARRRIVAAAAAQRGTVSGGSAEASATPWDEPVERSGPGGVTAPAGTPPSGAAGGAASGSAAGSPSATRRPVEPAGGPEEPPDPPVEDVEVTDLLIVVDLDDEVLVIDEHPRYHLAGCAYLAGRTTIPLPIDEARADGFTPCAVCEPDRNLAARARARKAGRES